MRTKLELWKIIKKYYPYYGEFSIKDNVKYISRSTVITDEEEKILLRELENYIDANNEQEGNNLLSVLIDNSFLTPNN